MQIHLRTSLLLLSITLRSIAAAQAEQPRVNDKTTHPDSLSAPAWMTSHPEATTSPTLYPTHTLEYTPQYRDNINRLRLNSITPSSLHYSGDGFATISHWGNGALTAGGSSTSLPGLMGISSGNLTLRQQFDNLTLTLAGTATEYGYYRGLQTSYGLSLNARYTFSSRLSLTLFGSYYTGLHPLTPAMAGYMNTSAFGGYISYDFTNHWGIDLGAQAIHSLVSNNMEVQPIVRPYYRINNDVKIGVDVGGILYNLLRDYNSDSNKRSPVIGPPRPGPPPVRPRN